MQNSSIEAFSSSDSIEESSCNKDNDNRDNDNIDSIETNKI